MVSARRPPGSAIARASIGAVPALSAPGKPSIASVPVSAAQLRGVQTLNGVGAGL
jgi:hypothetical protein